MSESLTLSARASLPQSDPAACVAHALSVVAETLRPIVRMCVNIQHHHVATSIHPRTNELSHCDLILVATLHPNVAYRSRASDRPSSSITLNILPLQLEQSGSREREPTACAHRSTERRRNGFTTCATDSAWYTWTKGECH